jgi:Kef-type K+ transport system membrane component KefB
VPATARGWAGPALAVAAALVATPLLASEVGHTDPIASVVLWLAVVLAFAKLGGELAERVGQPAVLGELVAGVVIGNLPLLGVTLFEPLKADPTLDMLARLGVLILLFEVGLESTVKQMLQVGLSSFLVASLGVITPFALGWAVGAWLLPEQSGYVHAFLGAALCATSVGITARVLKDLKKEKTREARVILGAAVIDDVMGLVILAVVTGLIAAANRGGTLEIGAVAGIVMKALVFLVGSLAIGLAISPRVFRIGSRFKTRGVLLSLGLGFCFLLSWLSSLIGLAPIVGAFAAGLILESTHYRDFVEKGEHGLEELVHPIAEFLVPVFFVLMGARTELASFAEPGVLGLAAALTVAAIAGKQACALGAVGPGFNRLAIGVGMIPRGEVGLIFANIGLTLTVAGAAVVDASTFSAVVAMVVVTTMITPPALKWSLERGEAASMRRAS